MLGNCRDVVSLGQLADHGKLATCQPGVGRGRSRESVWWMRLGHGNRLHCWRMHSNRNPAPLAPLHVGDVTPQYPGWMVRSGNGYAWRGRGRNNPVGGETSVRLLSGEELGERGLARLLETKATWPLRLVIEASGHWPFARPLPVVAG
jgi:hypothetical protein